MMRGDELTSTTSATSCSWPNLGHPTSTRHLKISRSSLGSTTGALDPAKQRVFIPFSNFPTPLLFLASWIQVATWLESTSRISDRDWMRRSSAIERIQHVLRWDWISAPSCDTLAVAPARISRFTHHLFLQRPVWNTGVCSLGSIGIHIIQF